MKKILLITSLLFGCLCAHAQGFYLTVDGGYGWGLPNQNLGTAFFKDQISANGKNFYEENVYGTLGQGLNFSVNPGYMFNKNIGLELGITLFKGAQVTMEKISSTDEEFSDVRSASSTQIRLLPAVVFNTGGDKLYGYAKLGLVLPVYGTVHGTLSHSDPNNPIPQVQVDLLKIETTVEGNPSLGYFGALGIGYHFTKLIGIHLEVFHTSLSIKPKSQHFDSYTVDGKNELDEQTIYSTQTNYVDRIDANSNNGDYLNGSYIPGMGTYDKDKPKDELAQKSSFNELGFKIGISFNF